MAGLKVFIVRNEWTETYLIISFDNKWFSFF